LLAAFGAYVALASPVTASPTLAGRDLGPELEPLEVAVSRSPENADALEALAEAYLEHSAPGLAQAALYRAPPPVRSLARVSDLEARALSGFGLAKDALASQERALEACSTHTVEPEPFGAGAPNDNGTAAGAPNENRTAAPNENGTATCSNAMLVHAERRVRWLRELVRLKADDRLPSSAAASLAYRLAVREVRLAVP